MTDDMIRALARKGGVVDINFSCGFLSQAAADAEKEIMPKLLAAHGADERAWAAEYRKAVPRATLQDVVAHIDHVKQIAGVDAVGLGSDFDGISCSPAGLDDVSKFPNLTRALLEKGYSEQEIRKIYGENVLRVMRAVERESSRLQAGR
jgi:membrane dipeptidase